MGVRIAPVRIAWCLVIGLGLGIGTAIAKLPVAMANAAFDPPPNRRAPSSTAGGGSRPSDLTCAGQSRSELSAIALTPQPFIGLSAQTDPTVWLYLSTPGVTSIELSLFNDQLEGVSQQKIELSNSVGLVPISLSEQFALTPSEPYYWSAALVCNPNRRTEDWVVGGWIQHQPLTANDSTALGQTPDRQPEQQTDRQKIAQYLEAGYWYDALTTLLTLNNNTVPATVAAALLQPIPEPTLRPSAPESSEMSAKIGSETDVEALWGILLQQAGLTQVDLTQVGLTQAEPAQANLTQANINPVDTKESQAPKDGSKAPN